MRVTAWGGAFYDGAMSVVSESVESVSAAAGHAAKYTRNNPFISTVQVNELLTGAGSEKETRHVDLSLEAGMTYTPGDAVGIVPENRESEVAEVLSALGYTGEERVLDHYKVEISFHEALRTRLAIGKLTRSAVNQYAKLVEPAKRNEALSLMVGPEHKARAEEYCWGREFLDLDQGISGVITGPQQLFTVLARLTPRMYSIASSQAMHADSVQTTVRVIRYDAHGRERQGLCSGHLASALRWAERCRSSLHANGNFRLPEDTTAPVIMIGPGTGIAPFRSFLEERQATGQKGDNWLFFGDQREQLDFLYKDQLQAMHKDGVLTHLDLAFSRDQRRDLRAGPHAGEGGGAV